MKKLRPELKQRLLHRARREAGVRRKRRVEAPALPVAVSRVVLPKVFSLRENFSESMATINLIREVVINRRGRVFIDFHEVERIGVSSAMVLTAEMFRCKYLRPGRGQQVLNGNYPQNETVYRTLYFLNFFRIFKIGEPVSFDNPKDEGGTYQLMIQAFVRVEADLIAEFRDACVSTFGALDSKARKRMQGAISEALLNSFNHAFSEEADFARFGRRAWLTGYVNPDRQEMSIMIMDQGAGIPRTLGQTKLEALRNAIPLISFDSDSKRIHAATQLGRTSTGQQGRGKGFKSMKAFVDACEEAELQVFSNFGRYAYSKAGETISPDSDQSLGGTLVILRARHTGSEFAWDDTEAD